MRFVCFFHFVGWDCISLGAHLCLTGPHVELHIPFGFVRVGLYPDGPRAINHETAHRYTFGIY